jgi:hypothetical protein
MSVEVQRVDDLSNLTSNQISRAIGHEPVIDIDQRTFEPVATAERVASRGRGHGGRVATAAPAARAEQSATADAEDAS